MVARACGVIPADRAHAVEAWVAEGDAASAGPVVVGEVAVGVEAVGEFVGQLAQLVGAVLAAQPGQLGFGVLAGFDVDDVGQPMPETADHRHMGRPDAACALRRGGGGQYRLQAFAGDRCALAQIGGLADAPRCFGAGDAQPIGQGGRQFAAQLGRVGLCADLVDHRVFEGRQLTSEGLAALQQCQPLRGGQHIEAQVQGAFEVGLERVEDFDDLLPTTRTHVRIISRLTDTCRSYPQG